MARNDVGMKGSAGGLSESFRTICIVEREGGRCCGVVVFGVKWRNTTRQQRGGNEVEQRETPLGGAEMLA